MNALDTSCTDQLERYARMSEAFGHFHGGEAAFGVRAPGRVDLMGSHTDYNQGFVMTLPINREVWILARPRLDGKVRMASLNMESLSGFDAKDPTSQKLTDWGVYAQGVAVELHKAG